MMAEAFGQPILDYDDIPEPGSDRKEDPMGFVLDERLKEMESGDVKRIPWEYAKKDLEEKYGPFDEEQNEEQVEEERVEKEKIHSEAFVGTSPLGELISKIYSDYREDKKRDRTENPGK